LQCHSHLLAGEVAKVPAQATAEGAVVKVPAQATAAGAVVKVRDKAGADKTEMETGLDEEAPGDREAVAVPAMAAEEAWPAAWGAPEVLEALAIGTLKRGLGRRQPLMLSTSI
jgi:hypothetical protein